MQNFTAEASEWFIMNYNTDCSSLLSCSYSIYGS